MTHRSGVLQTLEAWSPRLFFVGGVFEFVFATNNGLAFMIDGFSFIDWLYPTVLLGRAVALLGIAGLSVQIVNQTPRLGKWSQRVLAVAFFFTVGLLSLSVLTIAGITTPIIAVFGIGTVVLTFITYLLFGVVILRTGAFSTRVGSLLVAAAVTLLGTFVGLSFLPTRLVGGIGEGLLFLLFLATWYSLRADAVQTDSLKPESTPSAE
jgi:hypothetical protein